MKLSFKFVIYMYMSLRFAVLAALCCVMLRALSITISRSSHGATASCLLMNDTCPPRSILRVNILTDSVVYSME